MSKQYKPSVSYDPRFKDYVDSIKEATGLDGSQIIRLALFVSASSPMFTGKLRDNAQHEFRMPSPVWSKVDDTMWLYRQGEVAVRIKRKAMVAGVDVSVVHGDPNRIIARVGDATE
jgi:hypothetical protein